MNNTEQKPVRIDRWLWAARFFKTRALAQAAIRGGHVHLNGVRVKPSRDLKVGDRLSIARGPERFDVEVRGLADRRGPASVAAALYEESEASVARREAEREARKLQRQLVTGPRHRPDKRARRKIIRFTRKRETE